MSTLRIAGIVPESITDGPGFRYAIFTQGCPHGCPGCHNPETWPMEGGNLMSIQEIYDDYRSRSHLRGLTLSGGEPFEQAAASAEVAKLVHEAGGDVLVYTGYLLQTLQTKAQTDPPVAALLEAADYLIDGPFIMAQRDLSLQFRGSANQKLYRKVENEWVSWELKDWN